MIKHQEPDTDKVYLYAKDPFESNYQLLINGIVKIGIRNLENPKALIDCSQMIDDVYEDLEDYIPIKKSRALMVFDDVIADMEFSSH